MFTDTVCVKLISTMELLYVPKVLIFGSQMIIVISAIMICSQKISTLDHCSVEYVSFTTDCIFSVDPGSSFILTYITHMEHRWTIS